MKLGDADSKNAAVELFTSANISATTNGGSVDVRNRIGRAKIMQSVGLVNGTLDGKIQDSPDGSSDWQDVPGAAFPQASGLRFDSIGLNLKDTRGFIRVVETLGGGTPSANVCVIGVFPKKQA